MSAHESSLLAGLRVRDPGSFEQLVTTYGSRLVATVARILGNETDAQDAVQDALISAWRSVDQFEGASNLYTWLHRITVNACLARLRASRSKGEISIADRERAVSLAFEGLPAAWSEPGPDLEKRVAMRRSIQRAIDLLPEEYRVVLILRDVEELTSREVAERMGIPDATVRQRLHRARVAMAEMLRPELCDGPELTCGGQLNLLFDLVDEALPQDLHQPVRVHVDGCPACTNLFAIYRSTIATPRDLLLAPLPTELPSAWVAKTVQRATA